MPRVRPVLAIAWQDLRSELAGRAGLGLPVVAALLLLPAALIRGPEQQAPEILVQGDVPERVLAIPGARRGGGTGFREVDGVTWVYAWRVPPEIRAALDGDEPAVRVDEVGAELPWPKRSLFFALVATSTLTGAVSASIGGERARNTLQALLSAAVTRLEIVVGKWLAWTGFGAWAAGISGGVAVLSGVQAAGPWLLALPAVPALTVAIGLWLVRRTEDVIAGTSITLRVLPAALVGAGAVAYAASTVSPWLAALVPLGGALLAAGDLWDGAWGPTLLAVGASALGTAALLAGAARDLEQHVPYEAPRSVRALHAVPDGLASAAVWWTLVAGPVLWGWAGNPAMTEVLVVERGLVAGSAMLVALAVLGLLRSPDPAGRPSLGRPDWRALAAGLGVAASGWLPAPAIAHPWLARGAERLALGVEPPLLVAPFVILAQELWFRGWVQGRAGWVPTAVAWAVAVCPGDPLRGLASGLLLGWAARSGLGGALVARGVASALALAG